MKFKHYFAFIAATLSISALDAAIPAGYYNSLSGKASADLKYAVHVLTANHTLISSYNNLPQYFKVTDVYPESNRWWDMYSNIPLYTTSFAGLNREHSFPKSWWGGSTTTPAYIDLNHLYPSEAAANQKKSNWPLGVCADGAWTNGLVKVGPPQTSLGVSAENVFEPSDEYKGDFARTYFYMVCCYQNLTWTKKYSWMLQQNDYPTLQPWAINLLLKWHRQDKVSQKEIDRNDAVYRYQNNRNPFIDYPDLAEYIWGEKRDLVFIPDASSGTSEVNLITPVQDMELDFGQVAEGQSITRRLQFRGENLQGAISIALSRDDKAMFSIPQKSISATLANAADGYWLEVTYKPTALGQHSTRLIVSDGGIVGSRGVGLRGECLPIPTLSTPTAYPATNITNDTYTASWSAPSGSEAVDYWEVRVTRQGENGASTIDLLAEEPTLEIDGFSASRSDSYIVRAVRLGYYSGWSNSITVNNLGVDAISADIPFGVQCFEGGFRIVCSGTHPVVTVTDASGRTVAVSTDATDGAEFHLPAGVYMVKSSLRRVPVKVLVY